MIDSMMHLKSLLKLEEGRKHEVEGMMGME
jgi:hypothetical protein